MHRAIAPHGWRKLAKLACAGEPVTLEPGDVVVQLGNWHGWTNPRSGSLMAFVMMGAKFEQ